MRPIDADVVLKRIKNAIAFYSHSTQGDFDTGRKIGLISAEEIVAEEATNAEELLAEWKETWYIKCPCCGIETTLGHSYEEVMELYQIRNISK